MYRQSNYEQKNHIIAAEIVRNTIKNIMLELKLGWCSFWCISYLTTAAVLFQVKYCLSIDS